MAKSVKKEVIVSATDKASATLSMLQARFSKFSTGLKSIQRQASVVGNHFKHIGLAVGGLATAVGAGIKKVSDYGDEMLTLAGLVGIPVESFQRLRYAAIQNDVSAAGFDKSMQMLSKTMGEFNTGQGTLYTRLKKSNPALLRQLQLAKGNEESFRVMMNAIANTTDAQEKAFYATSAFGRAGQELISLANIGAEEMAHWEREAEKFGIIAEKDAAAMDEMNKSIDRVKAAGMGLAATITAKLVPALTPVINQFADWIAANREIIASKVTSFLDTFISKLQTLWNIMQPLVWLLSKFSWLIGVFIYAKVLATIISIGKLGVVVWNTAGAFLGGMKALGLFTKGISTSTRLLAIMHGLLKGSWVLSFAKYIWGAVKAFWAWNVALFANPITWIVLGIIALIAAIAAAAYAIYKYWEPIKEFFADLWDGICGIFQKAYDFIAGIFKSIKDWISDSWFGKAISWVGRVTGITDTPEQSPATSLNSSALGQSQANIMTMGYSQQSADINVRFDNLPVGARVDSKSSDTNLDMEVYRGANGGTI